MAVLGHRGLQTGLLILKGLHENAECRSPGVLKMRSVENAEC